VTRLPLDPDLLEDEPKQAVAGTPPRSAQDAARRPRVLIAVAVGGGAGSLARYGVSECLNPSSAGFPWGTFAVNVVGCLLIGVLMVVVTEHPRASWWWRPLWGVGFLGGFTTYSTMMLDLRDLTSDREWLVAGGYLVGSLVFGLVAVSVGLSIGRLASRGAAGDGRAGTRG
jgi:CrcB protein